MKNRTPKKLLKIALPAAACLGVAALLLASASAPLPVEAVTLKSGDAVITFTEQGACTYESTVDVHPMLEGEVTEVLVREGDRVKKGDALAVISAEDAAYQIQRLENDIAAYNAQIYDLTLSDQKEKESLAGTKNELLGQLTSLDSQVRSQEIAEGTRDEQIALQERIIAQERENVRLAREQSRNYRDDYGASTDDPDYLELKRALSEAEKAVASSEQRLIELKNSTVDEGYYDGRKESINAQIDAIDTRMGKSYSGAMQSYYASMIEKTKVSIAELREKQGKAAVTAPCDGVVSALPVKASNTVGAADVVATIGQAPMVEVYVPVREIDGVRAGDPVSITVAKRAGDETCSGTVAEIGNQAEIMLSPLGVEESKVRVLIATDDTAVGVGYQVDVEFTVHRQQNCVTVPKKAVFQQEGQDAVWVIREGMAEIQPVTKGMDLQGAVIIDEGLDDGDVVVADANTQGLAAGRKVAVQ